MHKYLTIAALAATFVLGSCGFEPLYGPRSTGDSIADQGVEDHLAQVKISQIQERTGQILRNHLLDKLNPSGEPAVPGAHLDVELSLKKMTTSLRRDGTSQRFNMLVTAKVTLRDKDNKKILYQDTTKRTASFSIGDSTAEYAYASTIAEKDAKRRAILLVADDLHLMLATYYRKKW